MTTISVLSRLINGVQRNVDLSTNTLSVDVLAASSSISINGTSLSSTQLNSLLTHDIQASASQTGYLSSTDWSTFNSKQAAGNYITALTGNVTASGPGSATATIASGVIVDSMISSSAAIAYSKLNLSGDIVNADIATSAAIAYSKLNLSGAIVNADIATGAAIAYSKLSIAAGDIAYSKLTLTGAIVNADIATSAAIAYSKLNLTGDIVNADIATSAAIAYSKLSLTGAIVNADIATGAAIAEAKLALDYSTSSLHTLAGNALPLTGGTMTGAILMGLNKITSSYIPLNGVDLVNKTYVDNALTGQSWKPAVLAFNVKSDAAQAGSPPTATGLGETWIANTWGAGFTDGYLYFWNGTAWTAQDVEPLPANSWIVVAATSPAGSFAGHANARGYWDGSTWTFTAPADGDTILVHSGYYENTTWTYAGGSTSWVQTNGAGQIAAGVGLNKSGNTLSVLLGAGISELPTGDVGVDVKSDGGLDTVDPSTGLHSTAANSQLAVKLDSSTLAMSGSGLKVATGGITNNEISSSAAIAYSKLSLTGDIVNADISTSAAIAYSKLSIAAGDIAYSKLTLTGAIVNADIATSAAIAYSKLNLTGNIVNADIATSAAIAESKLALSYSTSSLNTAISGKEPTITGGTTSQYWRGDKAFVDFATDAKAAAVVNSTSGTQTDQAASVSAMKSYVSGQIGSSGTKLFVTYANNTGATLNAGDVVALSQTLAGNIIAARANAEATCTGVIGIVAATITDGNSGQVQIAGEATVNNNSVSLTLGTRAYLSDATAKVVTSTAPTTAGTVVYLIGIASDVNKVLLQLNYVGVN